MFSTHHLDIDTEDNELIQHTFLYVVKACLIFPEVPFLYTLFTTGDAISKQ